MGKEREEQGSREEKRGRGRRGRVGRGGEGAGDFVLAVMTLDFWQGRSLQDCSRLENLEKNSPSVQD